MDDNTYECPNCGYKILPEMTRCPRCGQNMYPDDNDPAQAVVDKPAPDWVATLGPLLIGWMIAAGIATIVHFVVAAFVRPAQLGGAGEAILLAAGPCGAFVGAIVCTGLARRHYRSMGAVVGMLTLPVVVLLATHWVMVTPQLLFSLGSVLVGFITVLAGAAGGAMSQTFSPENDWKGKFRVRGWEDLLYQDLLRKVRFNGSAADRLIEYERKQDPSATRLKLIQNAIERWERDNN